MNSPTYSIYHYPPLAILTDKMRNDEVRNKTRIVLDYHLIVAGHGYMTGGGLAAPRTRDRSGGINTSGGLTRMYWQLMGEPFHTASQATFHHIIAASDYRPPEVIRSFFIDKGNDGYDYWGYTDLPIRSPKPHTVYNLGPDNAQVGPWQMRMSPDARVLMGINYGYRYQTNHVSMGVTVRDNNGDFRVLYHYQPYVPGDTHDLGTGTVPGSPTSNPDDLRHEGYDYERLMYEQTLLSIWDPTLQLKQSGVRRTYQDTRVHIPDLSLVGGEMTKIGVWYVGRMGQTYIGYRPLGPVTVEESRGSGNSAYYYLRLDGRSGCIIELATTDQFSTLTDYGIDLNQRALTFEQQAATGEMLVEFEALDPDTGAKVPLKLEFRPERRFIGGVEQTMSQLDRGLIDSPWVAYDDGVRAITLEREGYPTVVYDIPAATFTGSSATAGRILVPISSGRDPALLGGLKRLLEENRFGVTVTSEWAGKSLDESEIATIESSYDLIYFPWETLGPDYLFSAWKSVDLPILASNPILVSSETWGWASGTASTGVATSAFEVIEADHRVLEGVSGAGGEVVYRQDAMALMTVVDAGAGDVVLRQGGEEPLPALIWWQAGRLEGNQKPRAFFNMYFEQWLDSNNTSRVRDFPSTNVDLLTLAGKRLLLNVVGEMIERGPRVLVLTGSGRSHREGGIRAFLEKHGYEVIISEQWASAAPTMAELEEIERTYAMVYMTRSANGYDHPEWPAIRLPLLVSTPFRAVGWGWAQSNATVGTSTHWFDVVERDHPLLNEVAVVDDRIVYRSTDIGAYSVTGWVAESGQRILEHGRGSGDPAVSNLIVWNPGELGGNSHTRTFFNLNFEALLDSNNTTKSSDYPAANLDRLTEAGKRLYLNVIEQTLEPASADHAESFYSWREKHFSAEELEDETISGPQADPGGFGVENLLRYALGLDARNPDLSESVRVAFLPDEGEPSNVYLTISYTLRTHLPDVNVLVEGSTNISEWNPLENPVVIEVIAGEECQTVTIRDTVPVNEATSRFLRLAVTLNPES